MNKERIEELANYIENSPVPYDQMNGPDGYCVAGFAAVLWPQTRMKAAMLRPSRRYDEEKLAEFLDLNKRVVDSIVYPRSIPYEDANKSIAVAMLRRLAETGEVDWGCKVEDTSS